MQRTEPHYIRVKMPSWHNAEEKVREYNCFVKENVIKSYLRDVGKDYRDDESSVYLEVKNFQTGIELRRTIDNWLDTLVSGKYHGIIIKNRSAAFTTRVYPVGKKDLGNLELQFGEGRSTGSAPALQFATEKSGQEAADKVIQKRKSNEEATSPKTRKLSRNFTKMTITHKKSNELANIMEPILLTFPGVTSYTKKINHGEIDEHKIEFLHPKYGFLLKEQLSNSPIFKARHVNYEDLTIEYDNIEEIKKKIQAIKFIVE